MKSLWITVVLLIGAASLTTTAFATGSPGSSEYRTQLGQELAVSLECEGTLARFNDVVTGIIDSRYTASSADRLLSNLEGFGPYGVAQEIQKEADLPRSSEAQIVFQSHLLYFSERTLQLIEDTILANETAVTVGNSPMRWNTVTLKRISSQEAWLSAHNTWTEDYPKYHSS